MNVNFIITYLLLPIAMSFCIIRGEKSAKTANILMSKGMFYYLLAISTCINYFIKGSNTFQESAIGLSIYIAIVEGSTAFKQAIDEAKNKMKIEKTKSN